MTLEQVIARIRAACDKAGGQKAWADAVGLSAVYISDVIGKRREPGQSVLNALGLEKVVSYRRKGKADE